MRIGSTSVTITAANAAATTDAPHTLTTTNQTQPQHPPRRFWRRREETIDPELLGDRESDVEEAEHFEDLRTTDRLADCEGGP